MKKKGLFAIVLSVVLACCIAVFAGCSEKQPEETGPQQYTIQYTDDAGSHQITVTAGMPYSLDVVPERTGYTFTGLFDAEVGGTQYVSSSGASLSPFTDGKNMVLFPQFKAKDYTVILDYQGATVTGERQLTVAYGSSLPELPKNLTLAHKEFAGWYTKANCEGVQVADTAGLIPLVSVLNDKNFNLGGEAVTLYAGFEVEKFTVTCYFEPGDEPEELEIEYDTPVGKIVPQKRNAAGEAPLTWSKTQGGDVFNGKIVEDTILYAVEYAPVIELDSNGGSKVNAFVARAGATVTLPTPTKELAKFLYWEDMSGNKFTATAMPAKSISLKAVWQAKIELDENGGSDVDDVSATAGSSIKLPVPEKEGFIFAGWYTAEKEKYTSSSMPATGLKLKAGWYAVKKENIVLVKDSTDSSDWAKSATHDKSGTDGPQADWRKFVDLSEKIPASGATVKIDMKYDMKTDDKKYNWSGGFYLYDGAIVSDANFLKKQVDTIPASTGWATYSLNATLQLRSNQLYFCYYANKPSGKWDDPYTRLYFKNIYFEISYPDTANLYL